MTTKGDFYKQAHFEIAVLEFQKTSQESVENTAFDIWIIEESSVCRITETITVLTYTLLSQEQEKAGLQ